VPQGGFTRKFVIMLRVFAAPDGGKWTGTKMERATEGRVITSYFSSLRDGHIGIPRADKLESIAFAMGFPVQLWFRDLEWWEEVLSQWESGAGAEASLSDDGSAGSAGALGPLLNGLLEVKASEKTGLPYTDGELSRKTGGAVSEKEIADIRSGAIQDPTWKQVLALSGALEVEPSYWTGGSLPWRPSPALMRAVEDQESYVIFQNSLGLSDQDRTMLRLLSEHLKRGQRSQEPGA
jgi:hypothetical protein